MQEMTLRDLGNLMRSIRIAKNKELRQKGETEVTQGILAEKIGVSLTTISDWEQGKTQPGVLNFLKFCHALNISFDEVFETKKNSQPPHQWFQLRQHPQWRTKPLSAESETIVRHSSRPS